MVMPDPNDPQPTPDNPNPAPMPPPGPPEEPPPREPPGVPSPSPDPIPMPGEPVQIPPGTPPEIPPQPGFPAPTARTKARVMGAAGAIALAVFAGLMTISGPAVAQSPPSGNGQQGDPCQAEEQQQQGEAQDKQQQAGGGAGNDALSETLERCHGVLKPPPTGDNGIAEPAPDTGTTPIIPPGSVPEQPPK